MKLAGGNVIKSANAYTGDTMFYWYSGLDERRAEKLDRKPTKLTTFYGGLSTKSSMNTPHVSGRWGIDEH